MPQCISCACPWSVKRILLQCEEFDNIHYFRVTDLETPFLSRKITATGVRLFSCYWILCQILILIQLLGISTVCVFALL